MQKCKDWPTFTPRSVCYKITFRFPNGGHAGADNVAVSWCKTALSKWCIEIKFLHTVASWHQQTWQACTSIVLILRPACSSELLYCPTLTQELPRQWWRNASSSCLCLARLAYKLTIVVFISVNPCVTIRLGHVASWLFCDVRRAYQARMVVGPCAKLQNWPW